MAPLRFGLKQAAKVVMQERLSDEMVRASSVLIAAHSIGAEEWEGSTEFRKDGVLYDVAGTARVGGILYYRCIDDQLEKKLERGADNITAQSLGIQHKDTQNKLSKSLLDWLQGLYLPPLSTLSSSVACEAGSSWPGGIFLYKEGPSLALPIVPPEA
jgi:hypothetical protein